MINGIINVYKETGYTSFDVVARMRGISGQRKVGHTGTLDPDATGVLPIVLGSATKLVDAMTEKRKEYIATLELGKKTDTLDASGTLLLERPVTTTQKELEQAVAGFVGDIEQIPPMYSAVKVDGRKLYELARAGREVERKPRPVTIYDIEILKVELPVVELRVECSKGTYIRSLIDDIGEKLGCGAMMLTLKRTRSGQFSIEDTYTLEELEALRDQGRLEDAVVPVDAFYSECASAVLDGVALTKVLNGNGVYINKMKKFLSEDGDRNRVRIYDDQGHFLAIYVKDRERGIYRAGQMFLSE